MMKNKQTIFDRIPVRNIFSDEEKKSPAFTAREMSSRIRNIIEASMLSKGFNRTTLAKKMGKDISVLSKQLDGTANLTLRTISETMQAIGDSLMFSSVEYEKLVAQEKASPTLFRATSVRLPDEERCYSCQEGWLGYCKENNLSHQPNHSALDAILPKHRSKEAVHTLFGA